VEQAQRFHQQANKEQQIASVLTSADKKSISCYNDSPTNGESRWALVEPLRLFHPTQFRAWWLCLQEVVYFHCI